MPGVVTGKPIIVGRSAGRRAPGRGIVYVLYQAARSLGQELRGKTIVVQGFGNVGAVAARMLWNDGALIAGVSDYQGAIWNPLGLDVPRLEGHVAATGSVVEFPDTEALSNAQLLEVAVRRPHPRRGGLAAPRGQCGSSSLPTTNGTGGKTWSFERTGHWSSS